MGNSVVIVNQSVGYLTIDVCNSLVKHYENVTLISGKIDPSVHQLDSRIKIESIVSYDKSNIAKRIYTWVKGTWQLYKIIKKKYPDADILFFTNPPTSYLTMLKLKNRFSIVEYDVYPDALKNIKCPAFIIKKWTRWNQKLFREANGIVALSNGMKKILTKYVEPDKVQVIPLWPSSSIVEKIQPEENLFITENNLQEKFIVMYSGNIGYTHNVESIIQLAEAMKDYNNIAFLIIGEGGKKEKIIKMANEKGLSNCHFHDFLPADKLKYSLSAANIGIVTLTEETAAVSVPSKSFNLLSYGVPILNIAPNGSELGNVISKYGCGASFSDKQLDLMKSFLIKCSEDKQYYLDLCNATFEANLNFTVDNADKYINILN